MNVRERAGVLNPGMSRSQVDAPDTPVEWYDFGGGFTVAPGLAEYSSIASLACVKKGVFYFKILEGTFTKEDLPEMFAKYAPAFAEEVEKKAQETQNE